MGKEDVKETKKNEIFHIINDGNKNLYPSNSVLKSLYWSLMKKAGL